MKIFSSLLLGAFLLASMPVSVAHGAVSINPGNLIRGTTFSAVYYMGEDGFRYVFPNEKTYVSWYARSNGAPDFSSVMTISDAALADIQMGGNVTYHPGGRMVKINSDPKTYMVAHGGVLRWVSTEFIARSLYGDNWNTMIDDVPDGFFGNYTIGAPITNLADEANGSLTASREYSGTSSITDDKELTDYTSIWIDEDGFFPGESVFHTTTTFTIQAGETVRFFNTDSGTRHTATADDGSWGTGTLETDDAFVRRFDTPGTYTFHCGYHPSMTGTIIVE